YRRHGAHYPQKILFVAGLPKSGTTWLEQMLAAYPGFHPLMHPAAVHYEQITGGSHDYELPADYFSRFGNMLVVNKMHVHGSLHNVHLLHQANVRYVILYRDLRDVAVSYYFYVRHTPWHPEYRQYINLSPEQGLRCFAERLLPAYMKWIQSWHENRNPTQSLMIRYEEMVQNPVKVMTDVAQLFEVYSTCDTIQSIVKSHHFARLSHGRQPGEQQAASFFRKGIIGDWKTYFTPAVTDLYKQHIGSFLIDYEYESDNAW
ncbi:MAG: sulfotransferase domain-containing protein, partial [Caldilineaceae bacterium]|nr:sulfotransferase domain-containing protein [Caldilineaceae bacterium]